MTFGGTAAASFTVNDNNTISATLGSGTTGYICVTAPGGSFTSSDIFYCAPSIDSFFPSSATAGRVITITGANFVGTTSVTFGGTAAAGFGVSDNNDVVAQVGSGATGPITVTTPGGSCNSDDIFTFIPEPIIDSFTPIFGTYRQLGNDHRLGLHRSDGGCFRRDCGNLILYRRRYANHHHRGIRRLWSDLRHRPGGTAYSGTNFTFMPAPNVASFTPTCGANGDVVTITGTGFTWATEVAFGGTAATEFTIDSDTQITASVGGGAYGPVSAPPRSVRPAVG